MVPSPPAQITQYRARQWSPQLPNLIPLVQRTPLLVTLIRPARQALMKCHLQARIPQCRARRRSPPCSRLIPQALKLTLLPVMRTLQGPKAELPLSSWRIPPDLTQPRQSMWSHHPAFIRDRLPLPGPQLTSPQGSLMKNQRLSPVMLT